MASTRRATSALRRSNSPRNCETKAAVRCESWRSNEFVTRVDTTLATIHTEITTVVVILSKTLVRKLTGPPTGSRDSPGTDRAFAQLPNYERAVPARIVPEGKRAGSGDGRRAAPVRLRIMSRVWLDRWRLRARRHREGQRA